MDRLMRTDLTSKKKKINAGKSSNPLARLLKWIVRGEKKRPLCKT